MLSISTAIAGLVMLTIQVAHAGAVFTAGSYESSLSLDGNGTGSTPTGVTYSGGTYYTGSGGNPQSPEAQNDSAGALVAVASPNPGLDFRSLFTDATGAVYARGYANSTIYKQTSFGNFEALVSLSGTLDGQMQVILNSAGTMYIGNSSGSIQEWDLTGALTRTFSLDPSGGSQGTISIAAFNGYLLNYSNGVLSAYDDGTGQLIDSTTLTGAGSGNYGTAYANGYFFVPNQQNGYQGFSIASATDVPEPASFALLGVGMLAVGMARRRAQDRASAA
jgi:hypothetical protein